MENPVYYSRKIQNYDSHSNSSIVIYTAVKITRIQNKSINQGKVLRVNVLDSSYRKINHFSSNIITEKKIVNNKQNKIDKILLPLPYISNQSHRIVTTLLIIISSPTSKQTLKLKLCAAKSFF